MAVRISDLFTIYLLMRLSGILGGFSCSIRLPVLYWKIIGGCRKGPGRIRKNVRPASPKGVAMVEGIRTEMR